MKTFVFLVLLGSFIWLSKLLVHALAAAAEAAAREEKGEELDAGEVGE